MDKELVLSGIYLRAVLPLIEEVVQHDTVAAELVKGWNCSIMFHVGGGGPAATLVFKDGKCEVVRERVSMPAVAMYFGAPAKLNSMFAGKNVMPLVWKGIWHLGILRNFAALTKRLDFYMKPSDDMAANPEHFPFIAKLMIYAALYGAKEVAENDEHMKKTIVPATPDGTLQVEVLNGGPRAYLIKKGTAFTAGKGGAPGEVDAFMEIKDVKLAYQVFTGGVDVMAALGAGDVRIRGMIPLVDNINAMLDELSKYLK
jgi:hypothetical protein